MKITHEIRHGELYVYVTADRGTHHSTIAGAAWRYIKALEQPQYVSSVTGAKPGKWCQPQYIGVWTQIGGKDALAPAIRKAFNSWPVPNYTKD